MSLLRVGEASTVSYVLCVSSLLSLVSLLLSTQLDSQGLSENGPFPALPQYLGRFCEHLPTPVYECSLMLATRQMEPNLEY